LVRAGLAIITTLLLGVLIFVRQSWLSRLFVAGIGLCIVPVFFWSCFGLERWAPDYSDSSFVALSQRQSGDQPLAAKEVLATLGKPVFTGTRPTGETVWSYSYMPSSGFGWHKRIICLREDRVTRVYSLNEP
jgi:hypothetical protein